MNRRIKKKQRLTVKVIYTILKETNSYQGSSRRLHELVKQVRLEIGLQVEKKSFLPLDFPLGTALQVDHGEAECMIGGGILTCYLFVASVPGTTIRYPQLFGCKSRESWGEFHERTFKIFNGIFARVIYDNQQLLVSDA